MVEEYRFILYLFKGVGDSIAYIYIDRWDIKPFNYKSPPGFISGKSGFAEEKRVMREAATIGAPCILADLTNVLRYGDVYVFKDGFKPLIIEIKKGKKLDKRGRRQRNRLNRLIEYLDTDKTESFFGKGILSLRVEPSIPDEYHTDVINQLIFSSFNKGVDFTKVEEGLYYIASIIDDTSIMDKVLHLCKKPTAFFLNSYKINYSYYPYFPIALSIKDPNWVLDFYHGRLLILVVVDIDVVFEIVQKNKINIALSKEEDYLFELWSEKWESMGLDKPMLVSKQFFAKVGMEFLSLSWMINHMTERVENVITEAAEKNFI